MDKAIFQVAHPMFWRITCTRPPRPGKVVWPVKESRAMKALRRAKERYSA